MQKPPGLATPGVGGSLLVCDGNDHLTKTSPPEKQALRSDDVSGVALQGKVCPIVLATNCRLTADLLAESVEIVIGYGVNVLHAVRNSDDETIIAEFKGFDAAARTARKCAEELRDLQKWRAP